jgi:hypothetical protein
LSTGVLVDWRADDEQWLGGGDLLTFAAGLILVTLCMVQALLSINAFEAWLRRPDRRRVGTPALIVAAALVATALLGYRLVTGSGSPSHDNDCIGAEVPPVSVAQQVEGSTDVVPAARTGEQPGPGLSGPPVLRWRFDGLPGWMTPTVVDGVVFITGGNDIDRSTSLYALDARTGQERWRVKTAGNFHPTVANGMVYVGGEAFDAATGRARWQFTPPVVGTWGVLSFTDATVIDGAAYVGNKDGILYALDAATGREMR